MHRIGRSGRAGEIGLALSLIDYEDYHHFKIIEKKNKFRLEREEIAGFEIDESLIDPNFSANKPVVPPPGSGKKKKAKKAAKKESSIYEDIWSGNVKSDSK